MFNYASYEQCSSCCGGGGFGDGRLTQQDLSSGARSSSSGTPPAAALSAAGLISSSRALRTLLADLVVLLCQLLLILNYFRRLLDASCAVQQPFSGACGFLAHPHLPTLTPPTGLLAAGYPCGAPTPSRLAFLLARSPATFRAAFLLPPGELWVPLMTSAILAQLAAALLLPRAVYLTGGRWVCMVAVGLLPKAASLATFLALPAEAPSSYFWTYLPLEGALTLWQQVVYNYPFWRGMAVLAVHCALATAICVVVPPRLQTAGSPQLFSVGWVMAQTYGGALACLALQWNPTSVSTLRTALRRCCRLGDRGGGSGSSAVAPCASDYDGRGKGADNGGSSAAAVASAAVTATVVEESQLKAAVHRLLVSMRSGSCCSAASSSSSGLASSASPGSSLVPSQPESAAGSGSHATAAGVAQAIASCAAVPPAPLKARQVLQAQPPTQPQQQPHRQQQDLVHVRVKPLAYEDGSPKLPLCTAMSAPPPPRSPAAELAAPPPAVQFLPLPQPRAPAAVITSPPAGAFSLKQPTGLSKWTIVEDREFEAPAAAVEPTFGAIGCMSASSRHFRRYQSRAPPQRVHMKIPWAEPHDLPGNFLERLNLALSEGLDCMAVGVSVRAGCIELVLDVVPRAAFDSASNYNSGQSPRGHRQTLRHRSHDQHRADGPANRAAAATGDDVQGDSSELPAQQLHLQVLQQHHRLLQLQQRHQQQLQQEEPQLQEQQRLGHLDLLLGQEAAGAGVAAGPEDDGGGVAAVEDEPSEDAHGALEAAVLSGLLRDGEPASWIDALHLQPPPGAEVLTQACGRVWISRWDHTLRQWVPEKAGGMRPSQLPRITQLRPPCVLLARGAGQQPEAADAGAGEPQPQRRQSGSGPRADGGGGSAVVRLTVSNADGATPPAFSARCRGRYLPVVARRVRPSGIGGAQRYEDEDGPQLVHPDGPAAPSAEGQMAAGSGAGTFELELPAAALPRNGLVVVECKVGKLLSNWRPLIVTEDARLADDLHWLLAPPPPLQPASAAAAATSASFNGPGNDSDPCLLSEADTADGDAAGWDELANDLGLWLDYLEIRGLTDSAAALAAGGCGVAGNGGGGSRRGSGDFGGRQEGGSVEAGLAAAGAVRILPDSLDLGPGLAALYATAGYGEHMAGIGASLLEFAVDRGWVHTAGVLVRQMLAAGISWSELLRRCGSDGLTLLHRAVRSGRGEAVELVVRLGEQHGTPFDWQAVCLAWDATGDADTGEADGGGSGGAVVTPLHLAASLPDGGRLAELILREYQAACRLWDSAEDSFGMRPADCAAASGHLHLARELRAAEPPGTGVAAADAALPPPMPADGRQAKSGGRGGVSSSPALRGRPTRPDGALAMVASAPAAALRGLARLLAAPFVGDPDVERRYVEYVGAEYVLWCCGYLVYQMCMVLAVAGRMVKELRAHEMVGMLLFCTPHVLSAALLCGNYGAWLRLREPLVAAVTATRTAAKLLPVLGLLPYPNSATNYLSGGMDVLLEGLLPAYFERMRAPLALPLRALEGLATGLLYRSERVVPRMLPSGIDVVTYALAWTIGCGAITAALDAACRRRFAARGGGAAGAFRAMGAAQGSGGLVGQMLRAGRATEAAGSGRKGKKID